MNNYLRPLKHSILMLSLLCLMSCNEDEDIAPITINFTNTELGLTESAEVGITFSRPADKAGSLTVEVTSSLQYGEEADYYTDPAMSGNQLVLNYDQGAESLSFMVYAGSSLNISQDESIMMTVRDTDGFVLGDGVSATITVAENFVAPSGTMEINGGGEDFPNQVFIDLSKLSQKTVDKYTWDLGLYTQTDQHSVILNSSAAVMARPLDKTDIDAVVPGDTLGFAAKMYVSNYNDTEASGWIDHQNGDLTQTAFGDISATASENKVFIIKRDGDGRNWKKVRILQDGEDYTLQYADISATTHQETTITRDELTNFVHFDLDNGIADVQPPKEKWDIMYSTYTGRANFGMLLAINYNDYVVLNRSGVSAARINESDIAYDDFTLNDISADDMVSDDISVIGSSWRSLVDFSLVLDDDVYYVISDTEGNYYKLKFTRLTSESGERGYPAFKTELL